MKSREPGRKALAGALLFLLAAGCGGLACGGASPTRSAGAQGADGTGTVADAPPTHETVPMLDVRVLASHPHRRDAFTQGLLYADGVLYESTGQHGESSLRKVDPATGQVLEQRDLPVELFGEGLALVPGHPRSAGARSGRSDRSGRSSGADRLIQLTWQSGKALVWDRASFEPLSEHSYAGEGWGLTFDGERLVMSDGSSWLTFRDPETFDELSRVQVTLAGRPLARLNELEWVDGAVWANVWGATVVVKIDPSSGAVTAMADLGALYGLLDPAEAEGIDVLNGIAYRPGRGQGSGPASGRGEGEGDGGVFLVTGKYWPRLFEIVFEAPSP